VLILTPVKQAARHLDNYFEALERLAYPADRLSLGFLEGDSSDGTYERLVERLPELRRRYRRVVLVKRDFGFGMPEWAPRWAPPFQLSRRTVLAKSRNHLLFAALEDEDWVLWLDVDVRDYPPDVLDRLLALEKDIVTPHCVTSYGGPTFDWNAWRDKGRVHMDSLRGGDALVRLDAVGATMLLVRADVHRQGLIFPTFLYGRESRFARDPSPLTGRGVGEVESWGLPDLEILHLNE
jgi:GT2 family glycosyltransferase